MDRTTDMVSIWPLERIIHEYTENDDKDFVGFCDYLINSHCIGFSKKAPGIFKQYDMVQPIALTFKAAIKLINTNADLIC